MTRRSRPPPTMPVSSPKLCKRRDLTWSARATSTVNRCARPFAIFSKKLRRQPPICRPSSTSPAVRSVQRRQLLRASRRSDQSRRPTCPSKRSALPILPMLLRQLRAEGRIIVLDAARANPYAAQGSPLAPGLALVDPEHGELIAFNAAPGTLAGDEEGPYGVYGKTLAGAIRQGGVDIVQAFDQTRVSVNAETQGALLPWSASKLGGPFYVFERAAGAPPPVLSFAQTERRPISSFSAEDAYAAAVERDTLKGYREFLAAYPNSDQARRVRAILAVRREAAYWRRTVGADTPRAYWTYLHTYPKGPHILTRAAASRCSRPSRAAGRLSARDVRRSPAAAPGRTHLRRSADLRV